MPVEVAAIGRRVPAQFVLRVIRQAGKDRVMINASSLAFHWFISIVPGGIAFIGVANLIGLSEARLKSLTHGVSVLLPSSAAKSFDQALETGHPGSSAVYAVVIASLVAFWASLESMVTLQVALDMAYETRTDRGFIQRRVHGLMLLGFSAVLAGAAFALLVIGSPLGTLIEPKNSAAWFPILWDIARWIVGIACVFALISLYDYFGPNRTDRAWKVLSLGGSISTLLWLAVAACYSFYLDHFGHTSQTYGAFSGIVALLLWLFFTAAVVLLGAEFNREFERTKSS